jgi:hypothetical protein
LTITISGQAETVNTQILVFHFPLKNNQPRTQYRTMQESPQASLDPLRPQLLPEHQARYEKVKAWREAQDNPYFTEVPDEWFSEMEN